MADYKSLTELTALEGNVELTDQLMISRTEGGAGSDVVSYHANVSQFAAALSDAVKDSLGNYTKNGLKELAYLNHVQIEADNSNPLTSYVVRGNSGRKDAADMVAISSIVWDGDKNITSVEGINLKDFKEDILTSDVVQMFKDRQLNDGIHISSDVGTTGIQLAHSNIGDKIYSGDPKNLIKIEKYSDVGNPIAKITYLNGTSQSEEILIKNDITARTIPAEFGEKKYCGDAIAEISGIIIRNNLSVTALANTGSRIANINGTDIYDGLSVNPSNTGNSLAVINGTTLKDGVSVKATTGNVIANINGADIKNGVNVDNMFSDANGVKIANIAGKDLYAPDGVDITPLATFGEKVANIKKTDGTFITLSSGTHPHVHLTQEEYDNLKSASKLDSNTFYFTKGREGNAGYDQVGYVYRYRSTVDSKYQYTWFELWPDGWVKQGGSVYHDGPTKSWVSNQILTCNFIVEMKDTNYSLNTQFTKNAGTEVCNDTYTEVEFRNLRTTKSTQVEVSDTSQGTEKSYSISYTVEGYYNTAIRDDILKKYASSLTTTEIGVQNVTQTIIGGNSVVGQIVAYGGTNIPTGWLLCDGSAVSKITYSELYNVIGSKFGTSKDSSLFVLPRLTDARYMQGSTTPGTYYSDGLPDIQGSFAADNTQIGTSKEGSSTGPEGAFTGVAKGNFDMTSGASSCNGGRLLFKASSYNGIYGKATTVQPKSVTVVYLICWKATSSGSVSSGFSSTARSVSSGFSAGLDSSSDKCVSYVTMTDHGTNSDGTTWWYRKYSDGWCEQGGRSMTPSNSWLKDIVLPVPYKSMSEYDAYGVVYDDFSTPDIWDFSVKPISNTTIRAGIGYFSGQTFGGQGITFSWSTKGYIV